MSAREAEVMGEDGEAYTAAAAMSCITRRAARTIWSCSLWRQELLRTAGNAPAAYNGGRKGGPAIQKIGLVEAIVKDQV